MALSELIASFLLTREFRQLNSAELGRKDEEERPCFYVIVASCSCGCHVQSMSLCKKDQASHPLKSLLLCGVWNSETLSDGNRKSSEG